jgi:hypothetical protein
MAGAPLLGLLGFHARTRLCREVCIADGAEMDEGQLKRLNGFASARTEEGSKPRVNVEGGSATAGKSRLWKATKLRPPRAGLHPGI